MKGNPNDESMRLNFQPKVYDTKDKVYKPIYIAPDATNNVRGDVYLSDAIDGVENSLLGVTAATPLAVKRVQDNIKNKMDLVNPEGQEVDSFVNFKQDVTCDHTIAAEYFAGPAQSAYQLTFPTTFTLDVAGKSVSATYNGSNNVNLSIPTIDISHVEGYIPMAVLPDQAKTAVKGDRETDYRYGDVNLTPANIGALGGSISGGYMEIVVPWGDNRTYIRTPADGIIPNQQANVEGQGTVGTEGWPFRTGHIKNIYGNLNGQATYVSCGWDNKMDFSETGNTGWTWEFARAPIAYTDSCVSGSMLISGYGNYGEAGYYGCAVVEVGSYRGTARMRISELLPGGQVQLQFYYRTEGSYFYFGLYSQAYSCGPRVLPLFYRGGVSFAKYKDAAGGVPTGATVVTPMNQSPNVISGASPAGQNQASVWIKS